MAPQSRGAEIVLCERESKIVGHYHHSSKSWSAAFSAVAVQLTSLPVESQRSKDKTYYSITIVP